MTGMVEGERTLDVERGFEQLKLVDHLTKYINPESSVMFGTKGLVRILPVRI